MNLRTKEIVPQPADPFKDDLLNRKCYANVLTNIIKQTGSGFTLSINADWGYGKTTFVKMWEAMLQSEGYKTIYFNAWETDFVADPMLALIDGLRNGIKAEDLPAEKYQLTKAFLTAAIKLVKLVPQWRIIGEVAEVFQEGVNDCKKDDNELQQNESYQKLISDFREQLASFANEVGGNKPLLIFVDELDRCRPDYAVQMLERIKHFFSIDNIIFVLSVDKHVICESIKAIYGGLNIDTEAYLRRFIDLEFSLPNPSISDFISAQYEYHQIETCFDTYWDHMEKTYEGKDNSKEHLETILSCFTSQEHSLRDVEKYFNRLSIVIRSVNPRDHWPEATVFLVYFYMFKDEIYKAYRNLNDDLPTFWHRLEALRDSCIFDPKKNTYHEYICNLILLLICYINARKSNGYDKETDKAIQELRDGQGKQWFPNEWKDYLLRWLNEKPSELRYLCDTIDLVSGNFNLRVMKEFMDNDQ